MNEKVDFRTYGHFYVPLENEDSTFYASVNFEYGYDTVDDAPMPTGLLHVYVLHPEKGSIVTFLEPSGNGYAISEPDVNPKLEIEIIQEITKHAKAHIEEMTKPVK